jgi:hypothetical protein
MQHNHDPDTHAPAAKRAGTQPPPPPPQSRVRACGVSGARVRHVARDGCSPLFPFTPPPSVAGTSPLTTPSIFPPSPPLKSFPVPPERLSPVWCGAGLARVRRRTFETALLAVEILARAEAVLGPASSARPTSLSLLRPRHARPLRRPLLCWPPSQLTTNVWRGRWQRGCRLVGTCNVLSGDG